MTIAHKVIFIRIGLKCITWSIIKAYVIIKTDTKFATIKNLEHLSLKISKIYKKNLNLIIIIVRINTKDRTVTHVSVIKTIKTKQ